MEVKREYYLNQLISHKHNGLIKIIYGMIKQISLILKDNEAAIGRWPIPGNGMHPAASPGAPDF